ncbi:MAG: phosphonate ABC transporter, permease protein PhnE [Candidatus Carbobacillus altaicus]|nr:phosphonate ABC transporter, permease protein PhnE [Candidatus Carbobacillus altaicus]
MHASQVLSSALPRPPKQLKKRLTRLFWIVLFIVAIFGASWHTESDLRQLFAGWHNMWRLLSQFLTPDWMYMKKVLPAVYETIRMAILGTTIGALLAIPIILLAARNVTKNKVIVFLSRTVMNLIRTIPELLFAAIFVAIVGIGAIAGILAIIFFSFAIIAKLTSESLETIDPGPLEAMTAVGASKLTWIRYAVMPQILPAFISYTLYVFEINVRTAAVLGLVGAGGIGVPLNTALAFLQYDRAASIILLIFIVVLLIEALSGALRRRLI